MESYVGKTNYSIPVLLNSEEAFFDVCDRGILLRSNFSAIFPNGYVTQIKQKDALPLGKVRACMTAYEIFGNKHDLEFVIAESNFYKLASACERKRE